MCSVEVDWRGPPSPRTAVQARLIKLDRPGVLGAFERRIEPASIGYPLTAFITIRVTQRLLDRLAEELASVPEVIEVIGLSGQTDS